MVAVFIVGFIFGFLSLVILAVLFNDDAFKPKDKFTVSFRRGEDPFGSVLYTPKYDKRIEGPMAEDIYSWLTGKESENDGES